MSKYIKESGLDQEGLDPVDWKKIDTKQTFGYISAQLFCKQGTENKYGYKYCVQLQKYKDSIIFFKD